jgi:hypothetical protein
MGLVLELPVFPARDLPYFSRTISERRTCWLDILEVEIVETEIETEIDSID